jgi:hypothetical protein
MTPQQRRSIVWAMIERMAFQPHPAETWLAVFERRIHQLWELQPGDVTTERNTSFEVPFLGIICLYCVERFDTYTSSIRLTGTRSSLLLTLHDDPTYASKAAFHNEIRNYERQDCARHLQADVAHVLDGMIFHPRIHSHIEEYGLTPNAPRPEPLLGLHEIRIGGGIENAFVFMFHLCYQFCLLSEQTRSSERARLVNLFTTAIRGRETHVPAGRLFEFER